MTDLRRFASLALVALVAACAAPEGVRVEAAKGNDAPEDYKDRLRERYGTVLGGPDANFLLSDVGKGRPEDKGEGGSLGVNTYLWRASLDTLEFLPLIDADPFGGVINYDWYTDPAAPGERFKVTVFITDPRLSASSLNVAVNRQVRDGSDWQTAPTADTTAREIEDRILGRARELRVASN
jgi:hypothetical protein